MEPVYGRATSQSHRLAVRLEGEVLRLQPAATGHPTTVVTRVDGDAFTETWLTAVRAAAGQPPPHRPP